MSKASREVKIYDDVIVGCGSRGLSTLWNFVEKGETNVIALEASARIGGTQFLISRSAEDGAYAANLYEVVRRLPELRIWWNKSWMSPEEVEWDAKDWAYVLPQWKNFFRPLLELKVKSEVLEAVKDYVQLETPVSEITFADGLWTVRSGENHFQTKRVHWTLGLKALQSCIGKKESEEYLEKNPHFHEDARDAEGVLVANYSGAQGESQFVGLPVRHEQKLYLNFVSIHDGQAECFTFLPSEVLKQPKQLSFFEKSIRRTLRHTMSHYLAEPSAPTLGVFNEARGYSMASPWRLKSNPEKGILFVGEDSDHPITTLATHIQSPEARL